MQPLDFNQDQLEINLENQVLTITGKSAEENRIPALNFCIKGNANRSFKLSLRLDEHIEVQRADYENGLLKIDLQRIIPGRKLPRHIPIGQKHNGLPHPKWNKLKRPVIDLMPVS